MRRPAKFASNQGFLLVEAILSAIVIAVGIAFVGRGLSNQLNALRSLESYETVVALGESMLAAWEGKGLFGQLVSEGDLPTIPDEWKRSTADGLVDKNSGEVLAKRLAVAITSPVSLTLVAVWPKEWFPPEWQ